MDYHPSFLDLLIWLLILVTSVRGFCVNDGSSYKNNSVWQPEPCIVCTCDDPVPLCERIRCTDPGCAYDKGQTLTLVQGQCCPVCSHSLSPCEVRGQSLPHNIQWTLSSCVTCRCDDGQVLCNNATCPVTTCRPGEVTQNLPGLCCSQCIPTGRPCIDEAGQRRPDGDAWSPLNCVKCVCRNGHTRCMPAECPDNTCVQGGEMFPEPWQCCPTCHQNMCQQDDRTYKEGESWSKDSCTSCTCHSGRVLCRVRTCDTNITCSQSQQLVSRAGQCCPQCVARGGQCQTESGVIYYDKEIWQAGGCKFCACNQGQVTCVTSTCSRKTCTQDEMLTTRPDDCCPVCTRPKVCDFGNQVYQDGESWDPDPCSVCTCHSGQTRCYRRTCSVCPSGTARVLMSGGGGTAEGDCCSKCEKVACAIECASCSLSEPRLCSKCQEVRKVLQDGRCLDQCRPGFYPGADNSCYACHPNCHTCFDKSAHHCLTCHPTYLIRDGQCVSQCGQGFFSRHGQCNKCHPTCSACLGPRQDQCVTCILAGQVLVRGRCVDECGTGFFLGGRECQACPQSCGSCVPDGPECSSCLPGWYFHQHHCLPSCPGGYYDNGQFVCQACYPSCLTCSGPSETECTACHHGSALSGGTCTEKNQCQVGQYLDSDWICKGCASDCSKCHLSLKGNNSVCSECQNANFFPLDAGCRVECLEGTFHRNHVCHACDKNCNQCDGPAQCTKCYSPFLLLGGHCIMSCGPRKFTSENGVCLDCAHNCLKCSNGAACHFCDSSTWLRDGQCVTSCGPGYIERQQERLCEVNFLPPVLEIDGNVTVAEGSTTYINSNIVHVFDADTPFRYLTVVLISVPVTGQLMKIDKLGNTFLLKEGDQLTAEDFKLDKVRFLHNPGNSHASSLKMTAQDGQLSSQVGEVIIDILHQNKLELSLNKPMLASAGTDTQLTTEMLDVVSQSIPEDVVFTIQDGPLHGEFLEASTRERIDEFSLEQVKSEEIIYHSENGSQVMDLVRLRISDGYDQLTVLLSIRIKSQTLNTPVVITNTGGQVSSGDMLQISSDLLETRVQNGQDPWSRGAIYTLVPMADNPRNGEIIMMVPTPQEGAGSGWTEMGDGMMTATMLRFMQRDINEGRIYYKHTGKDIVPDKFTFEVSDTSHPPNILKDQVFHITVVEDGIEAFSLPTLAPGVILGMTILENQIAPITMTHPEFKDHVMVPQDLVYRITTLLHEDEGTIEHVDFPFSSILQFTQADIDKHKIIYRPPDDEIGTKEMDVSFMFAVSDGREDRQLAESKFTIRILPVNNNPPVFVNSNPEVNLAEGGVFPLTPGLLEVIDPDTEVKDLKVTVVETPTHGVIEKLQGGVKTIVRSGDTFSYTNLMSSTFQYVHSGGVSPLRDQVSLVVSDGPHQTENSVYFTIIKVDKSAPVKLPSATCQVNVTEGSSVQITREQMAFTDKEENDSEVEIRLAKAAINGNFLIGSHKLALGESFKQEDINKGRVSFVANQEIGPKPVIELVFFNISDSSHNVLPSQIVSVFLMPVNNQAPAVIMGPHLKVEEGGEAVLKVDMISVLDVDTPLSLLTFVVETPPTFGLLQSRKPMKGSEGKVTEKVSESFPLIDLVEGYIYYVQSDHENKEPAWDAFNFSVSDGTNKSPLHRFNISINLINDEAPQIVTEQLFAQEGKPVMLTNASMYVIDLDTAPENLTFTITETPVNGHLLKKEFTEDPIEKAQLQRKQSTFTYEDVLNDLVFYKHDDGETTQDTVTLQLTDGDFTDTVTLNILVGLLNDETPRVTINRGLRVHAGSTTVITSQDLKATDLDSEDSELVYTIMKDPPVGHLHFNNTKVTYDLRASATARTFKQKDIDKGHIFYVHTAEEETGNILFKFKLTDAERNDLIDQDFFITVLEDHFPPVQVNNKEFLVTEDKKEKLTTEFLSFTDVDTEPGSLTYTILEGPNLGHLELVGQLGVPIVSFTQSDLAASTVMYVHTSPEEQHMDHFSFTVSDGTNEVVQSFYINISPVDDALPKLSNNGLRVQEGVRKLITEFDLKAVDQDTQDKQILFTVVQPPIHGSLDLLIDGFHMAAVTFTMEDIYENRVSYQHDGSETLHDVFKFVVNDGTNKMFAMQQDWPRYQPVNTPQDFYISIHPMDDGMPVIEKNLGLQYLEFNGVETGSVITSRELVATDEDTPPSDIMYAITTPPTFGFVEYTENPGIHLKLFTQEDINKGRVRYRLTQTCANLQDSFDFDVMDKKPNVVPGNRFYIMWSEISLGQSVFNVTETLGVLHIPVIRRGNLKQYAIVKCDVLAGSAVSRSDISQPGMQDYTKAAGQVQFDNWQESKTCTIIINDDSVYEGLETFYVEISAPAFAVLGNTSKATVSIHDEEDEPTFQFLSDVIHVNETDDYVMATIVRSGDISETVSVICSTKSLTATGSSLKGLESGSDYISRGQTNTYKVVFPPGVTQANCDVKLIDDSVYESMEQFELELSDASIPATLGARKTSLVIIDGPNDVSLIYLAKDHFGFAEDSGTVDMEILREGSDLSHSSMVWCATRMSETASATPGQDYLPSSAQLTFGPGETMQICPITLLDDTFEPQLEGNETFVVFLSSAVGSSLDQPFSATVTIYDHHLDIPQMTFTEDAYIVDEKNKTLNATIIRSGDITLESSVICYTRQHSATVMMDFDERVYNDSSRIVFKPGEKSKPCVVGIVDDEEFEPDEIFFLKLGQPLGDGKTGAKIGRHDTATVTVTNHNDVPKVQFEQSAYGVHEPSVTDQVVTVKVKVIRTGATNESSWVRCSTRDGSAQSGLDYNPKSLMLKFDPGVREIEFPVDVLYNSAIEWHESFSVQLGPQEPTNSRFGDMTVAMITILDNEVSGSIVLPAPPLVVSLLHYSDTEKGIKINPSPGYPLVCVTPCDVHYPNYVTTASLCEEEGINQTMMLYHWEVSMPVDEEGAMPVFVRVTDKTLFTSVDKIVLDSIYFRPFFQVRCVAQPIHENGNPGVPLKSRPVTIGHSNPICKPASFAHSSPLNYQAQSFLASLEYIPPDKSPHPNTVHISVQIPHQDGLLPLISSHPLHNLRFLLSEPVYRQQHICSNIITAEERAPLLDQGFLGDTVHKKKLDQADEDEEMPYGPGFDFPHQFDQELREKQSLLLYKHLNLKTCVWQFDAWYHMTELIDLCGGRVVSDFHVTHKSDTHLTVRVPLYVSYVYATAPTGWGSLEHHTEMEFSFYYSTVLWSTGLETETHHDGKLQVVRILIGDDGKLVLKFRTQAKFRGQFVLSHNTLPGMKSRIVAPKSLAITFDLDLVWSQNTYDSPHQVWSARSQYNLKDYTGVYTVELIPCMVSATQKFIHSYPLPCAAQPFQKFELRISFQQTNIPVPVVYSLNTDFQLSNNEKMFLLDPATPDMVREDWDFGGAFSKGQKIYGRVLWSPDQDLRTAYKLMLEKVYLCTGKDGYVPTYDPSGETYGKGQQYGCIQPSQKLLHRFLILDRGSPDMAISDFQEIPFNAHFAGEDRKYASLTLLPGVDGFVMDVDPLYKVDSGHQWYLQVMYVIGLASDSTPRFRRSILSSSLITSAVKNSPYKHKTPPWLLPQTFPSKGLSSRLKRNVAAVAHDKMSDENEEEDFTKSSEESSKNGTNMKLIHLTYDQFSSSHSSSSSSSFPFAIVAAPAIFAILIIIILVVCIKRRRRRKLRAAAEKQVVTFNNSLQTKTDPHKHVRSLSEKESNVQNLSRRNSGKSELRNSVPSINKCNIIKSKDINVLSQQGINVESGTEV